MLDLDGSSGEGGGQILRTALTLSLVTNLPFRLRRIRANRSRPGLAAQHLASVNAAAAISKAKVRGASLRSSDLEFVPGEVRPGDYDFAVGTAGATALVAQTIAIPLMLASRGSAVPIAGGTHVAYAPCFDYLATTWAAALAATGWDCSLAMERPGFYPAGGGQIRFACPGGANRWERPGLILLPSRRRLSSASSRGIYHSTLLAAKPSDSRPVSAKSASRPRRSACAGPTGRAVSSR